MELNKIYTVDALEGLRTLDTASVQCCVTSPPYWGLRNYGMEGQYGMEDTPEAYVAKLVAVFMELQRVLTEDGTLWLNLGDAYWGSGKAGNNTDYQRRHKEFGKPSKKTARFGKPTTGKHPVLKAKDLIGLPWMVAFALRKEGWYLRQDIIWHKPNAMPESAKDRCTRNHEYLFLFSKAEKYYFDQQAIKEQALTAPVKRNKAAEGCGTTNCQIGNRYWGEDGQRNKRSVWSIPVKPFMGAHFATFPESIPDTCIRAGSKPDDIILDPFMGAGTTALAAKKLNRSFIGFELNPEYVHMAEKRLQEKFGLFR